MPTRCAFVYALTIYDKDSNDAGPIIADALKKPLLTDAIADEIGIGQAHVSTLSFDFRDFFPFRQESRARMGSLARELIQ